MAMTGDILQFDSQAAFAQWLVGHHASSDGIFLLHAKKGKGAITVTYDEALEVALCFGWIDGIRKGADEQFFMQRWTPRRARSIWSKVNRDKALRCIEEGRMQPSGLAEVERARKDGRWDAAYDSASKSQVPDDLRAAMAAAPGAQQFFDTLSGQNRYAILFRVQTAKQAATRARRIAQFTAMLARGETIY